MNLVEILLFAILLDALLGEPAKIWATIPHPAALMGRVIEWFDERLNHGNDRKRNGIITVVLLCILAWLIGRIIAAIPDWGLLEAIATAILLAQRSLADHVGAVAAALREGLAPARKAVAMIVGRDPEELDESGVARGAIESAAENFSDGFIAPVFWYLLFGLPGLVVYKMVNTADSMIGHKNERYEQFGWAAARLDDLMNWAPARITGGLICMAHMSTDAWDVMAADANLHRSPNAGWPEAAMAGVLGVALAGPRSYNGKMTELAWVNGEGRKELGPDDIDASVRVLWRSWFIIFAIVTLSVIIS